MPLSVVHDLEQERRENVTGDLHARVTILELAKTLIGFGYHILDEREIQRDQMILLKISLGGSIRFRS